MSNKTVRLDGRIDHQIGTACDETLRRYFELLLADQVAGRIAMAGGSQSLRGVFATHSGQVLIPKPKRSAVRPWLTRALGADPETGQVRFESFHGGTIDAAAAFTSMVHSAFLVLFVHAPEETYDTRFDDLRALLSRAARSELTRDDFETLRDACEIQFALPPSADIQEGVAVSFPELRRFYQPDFTWPDGLLDEFPRNAVGEDSKGWTVRLPYSASLRSTVRFVR